MEKVDAKKQDVTPVLYLLGERPVCNHLVSV